MALSTESNTLRMLALVGLEFYDSHLIGGAPPSHTKRWKRMRDCQFGDVVIELSTSAFWRKSDQPHHGVENAIGLLEKITEEPYPREEGEEPWNEETEGRPEPLETCYYIKRLTDGSTFRWTNARFATILPKEGWPRL
jgi:hypothetical protein